MKAQPARIPEYPIRSTEEEINHRDTVGQHIDNEGTSILDLAGTGENDTQGG